MSHEPDYPLQIGDRVFDHYSLAADDETPDLAVVLAHSDETVYEATYTDQSGTEIVLADMPRNREHGDFDVSDRVVGIAFAPWLGATFPGWDDRASDPEALVEFITEREQEWRDISLSDGLYDYPESRLKLVNRP